MAYVCLFDNIAAPWQATAQPVTSLSGTQTYMRDATESHILNSLFMAFYHTTMFSTCEGSHVCVACISYCPCCCDQTLDKNHLKEGFMLAHRWRVQSTMVMKVWHIY